MFNARVNAPWLGCFYCVFVRVCVCVCVCVFVCYFSLGESWKAKAAVLSNMLSDLSDRSGLCVCVCAWCVREKQRGREREREKAREHMFLYG